MRCPRFLYRAQERTGAREPNLCNPWNLWLESSRHGGLAGAAPEARDQTHARNPTAPHGLQRVITVSLVESPAHNVYTAHVAPATIGDLALDLTQLWSQARAELLAFCQLPAGARRGLSELEASPSWEQIDHPICVICEICGSTPFEDTKP